MSAYQHVEAFCLMQYACEDCGHNETIWNSRDGVTPFGCKCPSCGKTLRHVNFRGDKREVDHKLNQGQRFWRDGTTAEAEAIMRKRIETLKQHSTLSSGREEELFALIRSGKCSEFQTGWPFLDVFNHFVQPQGVQS